jgi:hypothetical protein
MTAAGAPLDVGWPLRDRRARRRCCPTNRRLAADGRHRRARRRRGVSCRHGRFAIDGGRNPRLLHHGCCRRHRARGPSWHGLGYDAGRRGSYRRALGGGRTKTKRKRLAPCSRRDPGRFRRPGGTRDGRGVGRACRSRRRSSWSGRRRRRRSGFRGARFGVLRARRGVRLRNCDRCFAVPARDAAAPLGQRPSNVITDGDDRRADVTSDLHRPSLSSFSTVSPVLA